MGLGSSTASAAFLASLQQSSVRSGKFAVSGSKITAPSYWDGSSSQLTQCSFLLPLFAQIEPCNERANLPAKINRSKVREVIGRRSRATSMVHEGQHADNPGRRRAAAGREIGKTNGARHWRSLCTIVASHLEQSLEAPFTTPRSGLTSLQSGDASTDTRDS